MRLYGSIGSDIDGNLFAQELGYLDNEMDVVDIRINSGGGYVDQGLSIVSAILSAKAAINVYIDGIAASMAAVVAICADRVYMYDYAKIMVHNPFIEGAEKLTEKDKKSLERITDTLRVILSRRGKKDVNMADLMAKETWFSAQEALQAGLVDEVVSSKRQDLLSLPAAEIEKLIKNEYKPKNEKMDLVAIAKKLGLSDNATEAEILAAIESRDQKIVSLEKTAVDRYIALGKANGSVTDKNEARMRKLAASDFTLFADLVEEAEENKDDKTAGQPAEQNAGQPAVKSSVRLSDAIASVKSKTVAQDDQKSYDWYQKNNPAALAKMEREEPEKFKKLLDTYENQLS